MNTYAKTKYHASFIGVAIILLLAYTVVMLKGIDLQLLFLVSFTGVIGISGLTFIWQRWWKKAHRFHITVSLLILSSFIGAAVPIYKIAGFTIYPFRILLAWSVFMLIGFIFYQNKYIVSSLKDLKGNIFTSYGALWLFFGFFALSWSISPMNTIQDIIFLASGVFLIYLILLVYKNEEDYKELYFYWIIMSLLLVGIGLMNHFFQIHLPISRINQVAQYQKHIPTAVFTNENDYASFLSIASFFFLSLLKNGRILLYKLIGLTGMLLSLYLIVVASSRANYIAVMIGLIVWFLFVLKPAHRLKLSVAGFLLIVPIIIFFWEKVSSVLGSVGKELATLLPTEGTTDSVSIRENLLKNVGVFLENSFGFGVAPGNIELFMKEFQVYDTSGDYNVHNWWAEILIHYGLIIFVGYVLLLLYLFVQLIKIVNTNHDQNSRFMGEALICGLGAFTMASISPNSFMALHYNWLFIGVCIGFVYMKKKGEDHIVKKDASINHP
ncbi:O-antigen ligase family protein [Rossellomorea sp. NRS-1567]|uniref:O-antigen ligase family protein n=1 Tax=Rossellomorea sp. NRS-1567 TaxID=3233901 RepID=UPI003D2C3B46